MPGQFHVLAFAMAVAMPIDADWLKFEVALAGWMGQFRRPNLIFTSGRQTIPGLPPGSFRADALLTNQNTLLALEVEVRQTHPDTNVGKYWLLADHCQYEKMILVHVYTPAYDAYEWRKTLGAFFASKMTQALPFEYHLMDLRRKDGTVTTQTAFEEVTLELQRHIQSEFKAELSGQNYGSGAKNSKIVVSVDEDPSNADWTKQTWDLPPYKSAGFFAQIGSDDDALVRFRQTPVYMAAVERGLICDDEWVGDYLL